PLILGPHEEVLIELRHRSTSGFQNIGRFRLAATAPELATLTKQYNQALAHYRKHPADAAKLLRSGHAQGPSTPQRAAAMLVASLILNLDEAITHE
ncbi:MAG: hypothetical protein ACK6D7_18540, partial [Acidobacteriota bacterium]